MGRMLETIPAIYESPANFCNWGFGTFLKSYHFLFRKIRSELFLFLFVFRFSSDVKVGNWIFSATGRITQLGLEI